MATQVISQQAIAAVPQERWQKVRDFFSTVTELLGMCFGPKASISHLDSEYRAQLSEKEKAGLDATEPFLERPRTFQEEAE